MSKHEEKCSICSCDFDLKDDGGMRGFFGILPVAFCPNCEEGIYNFADMRWGIAKDEQ
jgi:hypothetical protein